MSKYHRVNLVATIAVPLLAISVFAYATDLNSPWAYFESVQAFLIGPPVATPSTLASKPDLDGDSASRLKLTAADQFFAGDGSSLTTAKWGATAAGPFTSTFTIGNVANFAIVDGTGTGASGISVSGINATENFTLNSPTGTMTTGGTVATVNVSNGKTLNLGNLGFSAATGTGLIKSGSGTFLTSGGMYSGGFTLNQVTLVPSSVNAMGAGGSLTINGGTVAANGLFDFSSKYAGGITVGGDFQLGALSANIPLSSDSANLTF